MKKVFFLILLFILTSCSNDIVTYNKINDNPFYAINEEDQMELIYLDYEIINEASFFYLYTIYQNKLPLNFYSKTNPNIAFISFYTIDDDIFYVVDNLILDTDINLLAKLLQKTVRLYDYNDIHIILNNEEII